MANLFDSIKIKKPGYNVFDLSHDVKLTLQMGRLVPTLCMEVVPGDKVNIGCESMLRFAPMIAPVMHRIDCFMHYWFVPNRILWPEWENFITGQSPSPAHPFILVGNTVIPPMTAWGKLHDYMGIPRPLATGISHGINALPFAAYQMIYKEWYKDQNLVTDFDVELTDGNNDAQSAMLTTIRKRAWEHDYFTSCLPSAQMGAQVDIPLGDVRLKDDWSDGGSINRIPLFVDGTAVPIPTTGDITQVTDGAVVELNVTGDGDRVAYDPSGTLETTPTSINELRTAFRIQEWLEKSLRSGSRYSESILSHFGVRAQDMRLQRPEYITGTKSPVIISEVLNTTGDTGAADPLPQGNMSGHGVSVTSGKYGRYSVMEHGWIIGIMSVMPKTCYQDGIEKKFSRFDYTDYFWPEFANLGEQAVTNREVYAYTASHAGTFGYNPRYAEYKFMNSRVAGDFRDDLDMWHLGRKFATQPALNQDFIEMDFEEVERIFAVTTDDDPLWCQVLHKIKAVRPMPKYGNPSF